MSVEVVGRIVKDEEVIVVFLGSNFIYSNTEKMMVRSEGFDSWTFSYIHFKMSLPTKVCCRAQTTLKIHMAGWWTIVADSNCVKLSSDRYLHR
jgi:hypothetical protein